jgi:hypothetical protein
MAGTVIDIDFLINPDAMASEIAIQWTNWSTARNGWLDEKKELRNYLYATSTLTTTNGLLPWSNTTTVPKLTQIADNLHANYFAALFPQVNWMKWEALDRQSNTIEKTKAIQSYMDTKLRQSNFVNEASKLIQDYIIYGNCFASVDFERTFQTTQDGQEVIKYIGPRMVRISPFDIAFNPTAASFDKSPKIIRSMVSLGEIRRMVDNDPTKEYFRACLEKMAHNRQTIAAGIEGEKNNAYTADGFSSLSAYYGSNYVEVLTFYGDIYDTDNDVLLQNRVITVVDRAYVIANEENPAWDGKAPIFHAGWRDRPDNLYAMGPLDNLVGMQYRLDHLENLKADVFDQIAYPMIKIKGDVEDFDFEPGGRIYMGDEGDVGYLVPDTTALQADLQIRELAEKMEEMAGAPRQAMGIRTPGEKTAFEVQSLENSASRIFEHKAAHFERVFLEPILNCMLETARRNLDIEEEIAVKDKASGATIFLAITKEDILGNGKIVPIGARHFAERARRLQNLNTMWQIKMGDPTVGAHMSGKEFARILSQELGEPTLFGENVGVSEQGQTQMAANDQEASNMSKLQQSAQLGI